ncbi:unnamed protein product [Rotaria socialis]|uniref:F-box domain-containing protein n=1 Tax=Rotaria socialis TaxID=392032 RepID=A0A821C046_9BILA|nr:unnamed protein product [Rotaria socialis]CAF3327514.1 unnamed protein product [Rotaria socialis]CAF3359359.1 unnamed protein product [Rotaria socialis]CAF4255814.1 unnamed protein product [Rotaria socialis]CAF4401173.1 unnamed protein product [Rotaria socialis]
MISLFQELPELALIEIFSYLSCADALWSFSNVNSHLTTLLTERGFYRHINLSSTGRSRFAAILSILRFSEIESLVIDRCASPLQLKRWPYLPHLTTLRLQGVRYLREVFKLIRKHANTLTHLTVESSRYCFAGGMTKRLGYPSWHLWEFLERTLCHLPILQSLDLGMETSFALHDWRFKAIQAPLTYLKITLGRAHLLIHILSTKPLSFTLQQLHVYISDFSHMWLCLRKKDLLPRIASLHTFSFVKSLKWHSAEEWTLLNELTTSSVMPVLRRMNFSIVIDVHDLEQMTHSALFNDDRHIDVHYVFMINDNRQHAELNQYIPHGSLSHPRQIASATFISECWPVDPTIKDHDDSYLHKPRNRQHLFYTLPWIFDEFFQLCVPDRYISELQVFTSPSQVNTVDRSHLRKLNISNNLPSLATSLPRIMFLNQVVELHLSRCDRQVSVNLPTCDHLVITDSLDTLNSCLFSRNIRSIQITLNQEYLHLTRNDWSELSTLSTLPLLTSLRILLYGMNIPPNATSCQNIAETASTISDFCFCFRRKNHQNQCNFNWAHTAQSLFIMQLRNSILALPRNAKSRVVLEKDGYGLVAWF